MKPKSIEVNQDNLLPFTWISSCTNILLGALYVAVLSQVAIPLKPIPMTLQTFAIFSLALFQGSKKSAFSLLLYLFAATLGFPVFAGAVADPLWILDPSAGYCLSFPLAAFIVGKLAEKKNSSSMVWTMIGLCCGQLTIYILGVTWLGFMIGWKQGLAVGFYPFFPWDLIKISGAFFSVIIANSLEPVQYLRSDDLFAKIRYKLTKIFRNTVE